MQDYMSGGFAPFHMLADQSAPKSQSRGEYIFQQERKIKNDFLRKTGLKSAAARPTKSSTGVVSQYDNKAAVNQVIAVLQSKLVASVVAIGLLLFVGQRCYSVLSEQIAVHELHQTAPAAPTNFRNSIASTGSKSTIANGTAGATGATGATATALSLDSFKQGDKIEGLIAIAQALLQPQQPR